MCENLFNPAELKFLWKHRGDKNYDLKSFISNGTFIQYIVFEDLRSFQKVLGKIVTSPREGEAYHWPRLQHENLLPLIDTVSINEKISIYISPFIGSNIKTIIHSEAFLTDTLCFFRKKAYTEDILWALDYLHSKSLCLMNLTEHCIKICEVSDKAVICDFTHLFLIERASKKKLVLPALYQAPELKTEGFDPVSVETWACGVMLLQIFTKHYLPLAFIGEEARQVAKAVKEISFDIIKEAHPGAQIDSSMVEDLRQFLRLFLAEDPTQRVSIRIAATASFLRSSYRSIKSSKNDICREFIKYGANFEEHWKSYRLNWVNSNFKSKEVEDFKDIYQREIAKCRAKLKKLPCTNKFINLDFVPNNNSGNLKLIRNIKNTKQEETKEDSKTENDLVEEAVVLHSPKLCSEKLVIGDKETFSVKSNDESQKFRFPDTVNTNFSRLEQTSNLGDTEIVLRYENKAGLSCFQNESCVTNPVEKNISECNDAHFESNSRASFENNHLEQMDSVKLSENDRVREQSISSHISSTSNLINFSSNSFRDNSPKQQRKGFIFAEQEKKYSTQNLKRAKSDIIETQNFKKINLGEQNISNVGCLRWSDPGIVILEDQALESSCTNQTAMFGNTNLNENFGNCSCKNHRMEKEPAELDVKHSELPSTSILKEYDSILTNNVITFDSLVNPQVSPNHTEHFKTIPGDGDSSNEKVAKNTLLNKEFPDGDSSNIEKVAKNIYPGIEFPDGDPSNNEWVAESTCRVTEFPDKDSSSNEWVVEGTSRVIEFPDGDSSNNEGIAENISLVIEFPDKDSFKNEWVAEGTSRDIEFPDGDYSNNDWVTENISRVIEFPDGDFSKKWVAKNKSLENISRVTEFPYGDSSNNEWVAESTSRVIEFQDEDSSNNEFVAENTSLSIEFPDGYYSNSEKFAENTSLVIEIPDGNSSDSKKVAKNTSVNIEFPVDEHQIKRISCRRNDSYKLAISQGLKDVETFNQKEADVRTEKRTFKNFWSRKNTMSNPSGKNCEAHRKKQTKNKKLDCVLPIRDILLDGRTTTIAHHPDVTSLSSSENNLLNIAAISSAKTKLKSKNKVKKKWIQFFCPGSRY